MSRAETYEEIKPLVELCKAGRLFEVQTWISEGKPVDPPLPLSGRERRRSPLEIAMEAGFHSLVQVLLEGGASVEDPRYSALRHALWKRRFDLVKLLVTHGADINSVGIYEAIDTWNNDIVEYFIQNGADIEKGDNLAYALCERIRTALGLYMRYKDRFPSLKEQINIALRHHCKEGNLKWVSLMLWAGADPYSKGINDPRREPDPDEDMCALELAALYGHFEVFKMKGIHLDPEHEISKELLRNACYNSSSDFMSMLLGKGFSPARMEDKGSSLIQLLLMVMCNDYSYYSFSRNEKNIDSSRSREFIKMIHMLVRKGAVWAPADRYEINSARRSLLKMAPDYTMEFLWIMSEYKACNKDTIKDLLSKPTIRSLISKHTKRYSELMETF